jgi:hypothetical protein
MIGAGQDLEVRINTKTPVTTSGSVTVVIPELSVFERYSLEDMIGRTTSKFLIPMPKDAPAGTYDVMISVYQEGDTRIKYRQLEII